MKNPLFKIGGYFLLLTLGCLISIGIANGQTTTTIENAKKITTTIDVVIDEITTSTIKTITSSTTPATSTASGTIPTNERSTTTIIPIPTTYTNHVIVNYLQEEIFNDNVITTSTYFVDANGNEYINTSTITALGVLANASRQANFPIEIQNFGWGYYISAINGYYPIGFDGWVYNINQADPGWVGINDYQIADNDALTVFFSVWPWKITSDITSTTIDQPITFTAYQYASSTWTTSPSTSISINNQIFTTNNSGQYLYSTSTTGTISAFIYGDESYPQNSSAITVEIIEQQITNSTSTTSTNNNASDNSHSNTDQNNLIDQNTIQSSVDKILYYLKSQQDTNGKIIDGNTTDWAVMSFGANGQYAQDINHPNGQSLLDYEKTYSLTDLADLNPCASYPRHILSLLAGGVSKNDSIMIDLKQRMLDSCYQNNIYGLYGINDDVFGLLSLLALNVSPSENIIADQITEIKKWQMANGAFGWPDWTDPTQKVAGDDITGAVINAFNYANFKGTNINNDIITQAKNYLKTSQQADGGWGYGSSDIMTTSWVLMGLNSLGETQQTWTNNEGKNPLHPLTNNLSTNGYYESVLVPNTVDWFAMKYAVPALLGKSWPIILSPKVDNFSQDSSYNYGGNTIENIIEKDASSTTTTTSSTLNLDIESLITTSTPTSTLNTSSTLDIDTSTQKKLTTPTFENLNAEVPKLSSYSENNEGSIVSITNSNNYNEQITSTSTEQILLSSTNNRDEEKLINEHVIDSLTIDSPSRNTAKKILGASGSGALIVGLYLGLKLLKNLV